MDNHLLLRNHWVNNRGIEIAINAAPLNIMIGMATKLERNSVAEPVISIVTIIINMDTTHTPIAVTGELTFLVSIIYDLLLAYNGIELYAAGVFRFYSFSLIPVVK